MVRQILAAAGFIALAGCAQNNALGPSYSGLSDLADQAGSEAPTDDALRHVQSNKILGAMAFQKVTGRAVDPGSLAGRD